MLPVLIDLKYLKIYTFGVFLLLAFFWSSYLFWRLLRLTSYDEETIFDGYFYGIIGGLFFGRLIYWGANFDDFGFDLLKFILINGYPGLSLYGLVFGFSLTLVMFCILKKIRYVELMDYFVPPSFLALGIGKLGAFFSGSEVGSPTKFFLAVKYVNFDGLRHLTPFYEAVVFFILLYFSYQLLFYIRRDRFRRGLNFIFFYWGLAFVYVLFDRFKENQLYFNKINGNLAISQLLFLTMSLYLIYYFKTAIINYLKSSIRVIINQYAKKKKKKISGDS